MTGSCLSSPVAITWWLCASLPAELFYLPTWENLGADKPWLDQAQVKLIIYSLCHKSVSNNCRSISLPRCVYVQIWQHSGRFSPKPRISPSSLEQGWVRRAEFLLSEEREATGENGKHRYAPTAVGPVQPALMLCFEFLKIFQRES